MVAFFPTGDRADTHLVLFLCELRSISLLTASSSTPSSSSFTLALQWSRFLDAETCRGCVTSTTRGSGGGWPCCCGGVCYSHSRLCC